MCFCRSDTVGVPGDEGGARCYSLVCAYNRSTGRVGRGASGRRNEAPAHTATSPTYQRCLTMRETVEAPAHAATRPARGVTQKLHKSVTGIARAAAPQTPARARHATRGSREGRSVLCAGAATVAWGHPGPIGASERGVGAHSWPTNPVGRVRPRGG